MVQSVEGTEEEWCEEKERHKPGPEIRCLAQGQGLPGHAQRLYSPRTGEPDWFASGGLAPYFEQGVSGEDFQVAPYPNRWKSPGTPSEPG